MNYHLITTNKYVVSSLTQDQFTFCIADFVCTTLGDEYCCWEYIFNINFPWKCNSRDKSRHSVDKLKRKDNEPIKKHVDDALIYLGYVIAICNMWKRESYYFDHDEKSSSTNVAQSLLKSLYTYEISFWQWSRFESFPSREKIEWLSRKFSVT